MKERERRLEIVEPNLTQEKEGSDTEKVMITSRGGSPFSVYALKQWLFSKTRGKKHVS